MNATHSASIEQTLGEIEGEDMDLVAGEVAAGRHSLGDDESGLPFENGFDMAMAYVREAMLEKYGDTPPAILYADHDKEHTRYFFFGKDEQDVLGRIERALDAARAAEVQPSPL